MVIAIAGADLLGVAVGLNKSVRRKSNISAYIVRGVAAALLLSCVIVALSSAITLPKHPAPRNHAAFGANGQKRVAPMAASAAQKNRTLTFADRVAHQRAVEEVYWRHRIWPKENPGPKPSLDEVMSQQQIQQKVEEYLHNSHLLADQWQRPITPEQLQAEMERMASHTRQAEGPRGVLAGLGDNPFFV